MARNSVFKKEITPINQAVVIVGLSVILQLALKLIFNPQTDQGRLDYWIIACAFSFFFVISASLFSFAATNAISYYGQALMAYLLTVITTGGLAYLLSNIPLGEAATLSWIYTVLTVIFIVFLTIVNLIRKIVELAKRQDQKSKE